MTWGPYAEFLSTVVSETFNDGPRPPQIFPDMEQIIEAFWILSQSRPLVGTGPGPIPISEMLSYAKAFFHGDLHEFIELIQAADSTYLEHAIKRLNNGHQTRRIN